MMTEQLWYRCPNALGEPYDYGPDPQGRPTDGIDWWCECHGAGDSTLLPVSPSALLIEDGYEVIENCQWCPEERVTLPQGTGCDHGSIPCSVVLRAAVGEGSINPKDGLIPNGGSVQ
jgi:hypothetical protein